MVGLLEACQTAYDGELMIYRPEAALFIILLYLLVALFHKSLANNWGKPSPANTLQSQRPRAGVREHGWVKACSFSFRNINTENFITKCDNDFVTCDKPFWPPLPGLQKAPRPLPLSPGLSEIYGFWPGSSSFERIS